jgi:polar amino acid transport system substrate-binding protein
MQKARRITAVLLALAMVAAVVALAGCGGTKTATTTTEPAKTAAPKLVKDGVLTVGSDTAFPPFESMNGAVAEGFDVDLANAIAKEMGLTVNFTSQKFDTLIPQLKAGGTFDVIMSGMTITPEREQEITFSTPYIDSNQSIAVVKGKFAKLDGNDPAAINTAFTGKIVGVQSGTTGEAWAKENLKGAKQIVPFDDTLSAFSALNAGKVDAVVNDLPVSAYLVKSSYTNDELVAEIPTGEQYGIGIAQSNPDLKTAIDAAFQKVNDSGEYKTIYMKWFGVEPATK